MSLTNWSEIGGEAKWRDCMHASYLDALVYGGAKVPNVNTVAERERFENAEGIPETGGSTTNAESQQEQGLYSYRLLDVASQALYGVVAHDASETQLPGLLNTVGVAIALPGQGAGLVGVPAYPSGYADRHSVCVVPLGKGLVAVYDPLSPMNAGPSTLPVATIAAWHSRLATDIRYVREGEFGIETPSTPTPGGNFMDVIVISPVSQVNCAAGGSLRDATTGAVISARWSAQTGIYTWGKAGADTIIRVQAHTGGPLVAARYPTALCTPTVVATVDPAAAVAAAIAPLNAKINAAKAALG